MRHSNAHQQTSPAAGPFAKFPALAKLNLTGADLDELARQGFLSVEHRRDRTYYKLRFRRGRRQVVRYVGGAARRLSSPPRSNSCKPVVACGASWLNSTSLPGECCGSPSPSWNHCLPAGDFDSTAGPFDAPVEPANQSMSLYPSVTTRSLSMYRANTNQYHEDDALLNDSLSEAELDEPTLGDDEMRLARIDEYQQQSLRKADPLEACLGGLNSGLLRVGFRYEQAIIKALDAPETNILDSPPLQKAMNTHLGITRQVDRFANLEARLNEDDRHAEQGRSQRRLAALQRPNGSATLRNRD